MSVRELFKNKYIFNLFLTLFSFKLYFNHDIKYKNKNKNWIVIEKNSIAWDHRYAELQYVLNQIDLFTDYCDKEIAYRQSLSPSHYAIKKSIHDLNHNNYTKYEVFTSYIINSFLYLSTEIVNKKVIVFHIKHTRSNDDKIDISEYSYLYDIIYSTSCSKGMMYPIRDSRELTDITECINILSNITSAKIVLFTDWRTLYRNNLSLAYPTYSVMSETFKKILIKANCSFYGIIRNKSFMFATDLLM